MIIDYSGKGATAIFQDLAGKGVNVESLADLLQKTNSPTTRDVPRYFKIENNEIIDSSNSPIINTPIEQTGTAGLTLAEDFPGAASTTPQNRLGAKSPTEIVQDADTSVNITETLSTPDGAGDPEVEAQLQNFLTVHDQAEQEVIQTNLENPVLENAGEPTTEKVKVSANQKVPVSTDFMYQDGTEMPSGYRQDVTKQKTVSGYNADDLKYVTGLFETIHKAQSELDQKGIKFDQQEIKETGNALQQLQENEEAFKIQQEARLRAQKEREEKLLTDISTLNEEYRAVEIEPNRIFKNSSTGAKILAALSVGLGAYSASMTGGKNYALEIIDGAIADDIEAQKLELKQKGASIDDKRNLLNDLIKRGMSEAEAEQASRLMLYEKVQRTLKQKMLDIKDARMKQEAQDMDKQLEIKIAETKANLLLKTLPKEQMVTETKMLPTPKLAAQLAQMKENAKLMAKRRFEDEQGLSKKDKDARTVQGYIGLAPDLMDARKMREAKAGSDAIIKQLKALIAYREKHGYEILNRKVVDDGVSLATTVALELKSEPFFNLGVLTGPDLELIEATMPLDPTEASFSVISRYQSVIDYIEMKRDLKAAGLGLYAERPEMDLSKMDFKESANQSKKAALAN